MKIWFAIEIKRKFFAFDFQIRNSGNFEKNPKWLLNWIMIHDNSQGLEPSIFFKTSNTKIPLFTYNGFFQYNSKPSNFSVHISTVSRAEHCTTFRRLPRAFESRSTQITRRFSDERFSRHEKQKNDSSRWEESCRQWLRGLYQRCSMRKGLRQIAAKER